MINRARANPAAEGARLAATTDNNVLGAYSYFNVNLGMMQGEFNVIPVRPPLAPNAHLTAAARGHSAWMLANDVQAHNQTNPANTPWERIIAAGYSYSVAGENVFAFAKSVWHGHAGFQVDWGYGTGGMQSPRGHRDSIHSGEFREIGVGVVLGDNASVGPQLVTQDFGKRFASPSLGTGVAFYDLNGNGFYDIGEGISGLTVNVSGTADYCITATGGGWTVPIPATAATRTVTFSGLSMDQDVTLTVPASSNAKADLILSYSPPAITSAGEAVADTPHTVEFAAVGGASGYQWKCWESAAGGAENCDSTARITSSTTGSYSVLNSSVKQEGTAAFHLENSTGDSQWIELDQLFFGMGTPSLSFQSRVRYATTSEFFRVQVMEEGGTLWQDVYSQAGTSGSGESSFTLRSATLTGMSGKGFRVRFLHEHTGSYYPSSGNNMGWFIDAISLSGVSSLENQVSQVLAGTSGSSTYSAGSYLMAVAPLISGREFPASYQSLTVVAPPPEASFATWAGDHETDNGLAPGTISDPTADHDRDGRPHLVEYAFGTSPVIANDPAPRMPVVRVTATHFVIQYQRDTGISDVVLTAQASDDLETWRAPGEAGAPAGFVDEVISTDGNLETHEAKVPLSTGGPIFLRVRISQF